LIDLGRNTNNENSGTLNNLMVAKNFKYTTGWLLIIRDVCWCFLKLDFYKVKIGIEG